jgi:hypothetical protein
VSVRPPAGHRDRALDDAAPLALGVADLGWSTKLTLASVMCIPPGCLAGRCCPALGPGGRWTPRHANRPQVAGYIAKYATKATESFGAGLDQRLTAADDLEHLDKLPAHVAELVRACWELGSRPELDSLRLRAWAHMLGFGGHWSTKSRRYSTTVTVLRRARVALAKRRQARHGTPLDALPARPTRSGS